MSIPPDVVYFIRIACGVCWALAYVLIIYRGFKDQTFGMPIVACCANISWEFIYAFVHPYPPPRYYLYIWFGLDLLILYQVFYYGPKEMAHLFSKRWFYLLLPLGICFSYGLIYGLSLELKTWDGMDAAFRQNLMMSILFLFMFFERQDLRGQSLWIAGSKMMGTVLPALLHFARNPDILILNLLYLGVFLFDTLYILVLYQKYRILGIKPWARL